MIIKPINWALWSSMTDNSQREWDNQRVDG